jgi:serine protease
MKRSFSVISIAVVFALVIGSASVSTGFTSQQDGKIRVLVNFLPGNKAGVDNALKGLGAEFHYTFDDLNTFAVTVPEAALNGLSRNPNVVYIEEDVLRYPISIRPSNLTSAQASGLAAPAGQTAQIVPYGVDMVQAPQVWAADPAANGSTKKICIIDSGVYSNHEDLFGNTLSGFTSTTLPWDVDGSGHGTHVTGTITARNNGVGVVGVLPGTGNIYMVRVFGNDGLWAYSSTLIDAANKCYAAGANIISMSLGGSRSSRTEQTGFDSLYSKGVLSIAAASNDGTSAYSYPASYASVVSVAAIDSNMAWATFSNFNSQVELAAPGVGVLSTVSYLESNSLGVDGTAYLANHIEFSGRGSASGSLVDGGLCGSVGSWSGKVVLCQRGTYDFYTKVMNVQNGGGVAAVISNNVSGNFLGTLGTGSSSNIIGLSVSMEDGQYLVTNKLNTTATVTSSFSQPASGYEYYDGTSMATPHVSAVAAMVWSAVPAATNVQVRNALTSTARDLGAAGRDVYYGFGLVQAKAAYDLLKNSSTPPVMHVAALTGTSAWVAGGTSNWKATITVTIKDANNAIVSGAAVTGSWSGGVSGTGTCTTGTTGQCSLTSANIKKTKTSESFTVTGVVKSGSTYNAAANTITKVTVSRP